MTFLNVGIAIISGIGVGVLFGFLISLFFNNFEINNINKILILIAIGAGLVVLEIFVEKWFIFSSLLAVIVMCLIVRIKNKPLSLILAKNTSQIWVVAEMFLFFLVGASIETEFASKFILTALALIGLSLFARLLMVYGCLVKTKLNQKERLLLLSHICQKLLFKLPSEVVYWI